MREMRRAQRPGAAQLGEDVSLSAPYARCLLLQCPVVRWQAYCKFHVVVAPQTWQAARSRFMRSP
jgi:hypothetical protein